ncbi:MAG: peptidylprolyl isomerase, partial [Bacteroidota bacterium]
TILLFLGLICNALSVFAQPGKSIDKIIGGVGNEIILLSELENGKYEITQGKNSLSRQRECGIFEDLLYQKLLLHQAKIDSVEVTDGEVNNQVERRISYFLEMFGSVEAFEAYYGKSVAELKLDFYDLIKDQLLVQKKQDEITKNVQITPSMVLKYYNTLPADSLPLIGEQVQYSQIVVSPMIPEKENQRIIQFLDSIRADIIAGRTSMTIQARRWSEDPGSKYKGGCYDMLRKGSFVPEYESAVFTTNENDYSPVFKSVYGYHFVKTIEKRGEFYRSCHILMSPKISDADFDKCRLQMDTIHQLLKDNKVSFTSAASRYSTDEDTKNAFGKVMNMQSGGTRHDVATLSPELNLALSKLKVGEISEPMVVKQPNGKDAYVIFKLDARISAHRANMEQDYELFQAKTDALEKQRVTDLWVQKALKKNYSFISEEYKNCNYSFNWNLK